MLNTSIASNAQNGSTRFWITRAELESLPGVGRKTASVILNIAFDKPTIAVDTHVFRVTNRLGLVNSKTPIETENQLLKIVPKKWAKTAGNLLLLHGRYICTAKNPKCIFCPLRKFCANKLQRQ